MKTRFAYLLGIWATTVLVACSSDDSSTGSSSGSCDTSALPSSSLSFESTAQGCSAQSSMDAVAFTNYIADYTNAGWLPVTASPTADGGTYTFSKQDGSVSHSVTLSSAAGTVTVVYVKSGDGSSNNGDSGSGKTNASTCDLATQSLPASQLAWQPTFAGGCEVAQEFALADLQTLDDELIEAGFEKNALSDESYRYTRLRLDAAAYHELAYRDTLAFTYTMGTFVGTFKNAELPLGDVGYIVVNYLTPFIPEEDMPKFYFMYTDGYTRMGYVSGGSKIGTKENFIEKMKEIGFKLSLTSDDDPVFYYNATISDGTHGTVQLKVRYTRKTASPAAFAIESYGL